MHRDGRRSRPWHADVAQLVAHHLAKVRVAGSNPVIRSKVQWHQPQRWSGRVVRQRPAKPCTRVRFPSPPRAISSAGERFPDTEEVTGSIPVSRTIVYAGQDRFSPVSSMLRTTYAPRREPVHHVTRIERPGTPAPIDRHPSSTMPARCRGREAVAEDPIGS